MIFFSCTKEKKEQLSSNHKEKINESSYIKVGEELLRNVKFRNWKTNAKPTNWEINDKIKSPEKYVVDRDTLDLMLKGSAEQEIYIKQKLNVEPSKFYVVEAKIETSLKHNSNSGLIVTSEENNVIAKVMLDSKGVKVYRVVFNSGNNNNVSCYFGFIEKEQGVIKIKSLTLKKIELVSDFYLSSVARTFNEDLHLDLNNEDTFDEGVRRIVEYTSKLLLANKRKDTISIARANVILKSLDTNSLFKKKLEASNKNITHSFETKLVYSCIDVLTEFNIGTQRIELFKNKNRVHMLINYYNPYINQWKTIDPFYNSMLNINEDLSIIKEDQIRIIEFGGLSKNISGLIKKYSGSEVIIKKEKIVGYPF